MESNGVRRVLALMRHAKAEPFAEGDEARELTPIGRKAAASAGRWLAERGLVPDQVIVSAASRTRQTWDEVDAACPNTAVVDVEQGLYSADPESALEIIRDCPASAHQLLVIGHNPTIAFLAQVLGDSEPDPDAFHRLSLGFAPGAVAVLEPQQEWSALAEAGARLTGFFTP